MDYLLQEGTITLPDDFYDRSVNTFVLGSTIPAPLSMTIARDTMRPDEEMSQYINRQVKLLKSHFKVYKVVEQQTVQLANHPEIAGAQIEAYYKTEGRYYYQKQAAFEIKPQKILVFSYTSQEKFTDVQNQLWQDLLASYRQRAS